MRIRAGILALAAAAALAAPLAAQSGLRVEKLADGVWAASPEKGANVGWFLLGDGVVAVDAGIDAATGQAILKQIAETTGGKLVRVLVLTHSHADHSGGARVFVAAGARVICQENVVSQILAFVSQVATDPADPMAGKPNLRPVVESISERAIFVDGIHNIQIYFLGAAHTKGDLAIYLSSEKILFAGDLALNALLPFLQSPEVDPAGWERALQALSRVSVEKLVPGHGQIGPKAGLADSYAYVRRVNELAKKIVESGQTDEAIEILVRAPENRIENVPVTEAHIANVKAATRSLREKASRKPTPAPTPVPTPAGK
ncbi:MAG: MBL fold metallo-hydrolase [Thermoanaerobaculia bacterium]